MIKVGLCGTIGSGKSTVCRIFEQLGVEVYIADDRAKELMTTSPELLSTNGVPVAASCDEAPSEKGVTVILRFLYVPGGRTA